MKKCPTCGSTVQAENECPICAASLTYESSVAGEKEKLVLGKYFALYLLKNTWFSLVCLIVAVFRMIIAAPSLNVTLGLSILFASLSLVIALFQRSLIRLYQRFLTERYAIFRVTFRKIIFGLIAVVLSFIM